MEIREYGDPAAQIVILQPVDVRDFEMAEAEAAALREKTGKDIRLVAFGVEDWNRDLSPWEAPPVFGKEGFGAGAEETLREILAYADRVEGTCYIGGYSLAGLFSLWAVTGTDRFAGVAAVSPSVWFPGFYDYLEEHPVTCGAVYLSLGDREERTRNPVMATVGDRIREIYSLLRREGVPCTLEWNEGNHFRDPDLRTVQGFARLLDCMKGAERMAAITEGLSPGDAAFVDRMCGYCDGLK